MSQIETAVLASKKIEAILRDGFGAQGRGLHEYLASVEQRIPAAIVKKARYIASVRNQVVHNDGVIADLAEFNQTVDEVVAALNNQLAQEQMAREHEERLQRELAASQHSVKPQTVAVDDIKSEHTDLILSLEHFKTQNNYLVFILCVLFCLCVYLFLRPNSQHAAPAAPNTASAEMVQMKSQIAHLNNELRNQKRKFAALEAQVKQITANAARKEPMVEPTQKAALAPTNPKTSKAVREDATNTADLKLSQQRQVIEPGKVDEQFQPVEQENSLLAKARSATNEYDKAYQDIQVNFVRFVQEQTKVTLGQPDVFQKANGTYSVRVPVSWTIPERELLSRFNRYFNSYDSKPLKVTSEQKRLVISKRHAESSTAIKPYSGRLFGDLQKVELAIEVSLGNKKGRIIIAGNARCHVSCGYSDKASDSWIIQSTGKPGLSNLDWQQESPLVIEGFTEQDLQTAAKPIAVVKVGRN